ncbi:MAG: type IV secretion system protein, partial [Pseudomonadota bacterium]
MASFIVDTLKLIDGSVSSYAQTVFTGVSGSVNGVILAAGLVGLPLLAFNAIMQFHPIRMSQFVTWGIRYVIILTVATSWAQFQPIYRILTEVPNSYGGALLSAAGFGVPTTGGLNAAMDEMVTSIYAYSDRANEESGILSIGLAGFALWLLGSLMACVAIIVSAIAKIGIAMAVSLAPIAIASMMFRGTKQFFESWSRFTIGFALIPLVLAGVMGAVLGVAGVLIGGVEKADDLSQGAGFIIVVLAAIFMMYQIPTLVSGLAGSIVASASAGFVVASAAAGLKPASYTA